jgi:UDPglucose 6-dehydrogenase
MDNRIGSKFLHAGPGYGGSCFPKDTLALLKTAEDYDSPTRIVEAVVKVNDSRKRAMGRKVLDALGGIDAARGKKVALLGLTFKPNTDDMRDSPAIAVAQTLTDAGVEVAAYDPEGMELAKPLMPEVSMVDDPYAAIEGADAVAIVTEWDAFRALDLARVKELAKAPVLVDLRNIYRPDDVRAAGFKYSSIGRG